LSALAPVHRYRAPGTYPHLSRPLLDGIALWHSFVALVVLTPRFPNEAHALECTAMPSLARSLFMDSQLAVDSELPRAGTALENPFVYDAVAREFKQMAHSGLVEIVHEHAQGNDDGALIDSLQYRRTRIG
jgi:hypothetical protein